MKTKTAVATDTPLMKPRMESQKLRVLESIRQTRLVVGDDDDSPRQQRAPQHGRHQSGWAPSFVGIDGDLDDRVILSLPKKR
jgi:hypothetical protein